MEEVHNPRGCSALRLFLDDRIKGKKIEDSFGLRLISIGEVLNGQDAWCAKSVGPQAHRKIV